MRHDATSKMAFSATLHCLTGCAIGEVAGMMAGTGLGWSPAATVGLSIALAFVFGYSLSLLPLVRAGVALAAALKLVLAADTLSIATMEVVDNLVVAIFPGALNAGLTNPVFWLSLIVSLMAAFVAAYPVNRYLLQRGQGHALKHQYHTSDHSTKVLFFCLAGFLAGALVVSTAAFLETWVNF